MIWFNYYGLIFMAIIMLPNIVYAVKHKNDVVYSFSNKAAEVLEQISRYACIIFMIFNVPYTWKGFYFPYAKVLYIIVNTILIVAYCLAWIITWNKSGIGKALVLSIIPSIVFLFSGVIIASIPLLVFAVIFSITHVLISFMNAKILGENN